MKRLIIKYLIIVAAISILTVVINGVAPDLFTKQIEAEGYTQTKMTLIGFFQFNFFNIILGIFMAIDLYKIKANWLITPILTVLSIVPGLFFFSILILNNLIATNE